MIAMIQPLHAGNALRLIIEPPVNAVRWKVLRKTSDTFTGHGDASALVVYDGNERSFIDCAALPNQVIAFYRPYYTADGATWIEGTTAYATPVASYQDGSVDVPTLLRDRLEAGLKVEVERGNLVSDIGYIQTFIASPSLERDLSFPLVTIHLDDESSGDRFIGDELAPDVFDAIGDEWEEGEGWIAKIKITIIGWALNGDERAELRKAIRRVIASNMPIFADKGIYQIDVKQSDVDALNGEYPAPMYQVMTSFTCSAPVHVYGGVTPIHNVEAEEITP